MPLRRLALSFLLAIFPSLCLAAPPSLDWTALHAEALQHYQALVQIDTSASNETQAVTYLKNALEAAGIPVKTYALQGARANLVARLKGNGSKRPLLLVGHTDVVGVQKDRWPVPPFSATRKDGYVWGRGTVDDKDNLTACLMMMVLLKRSQVPLDRDVIFLAESGEEGDNYVGMGYMVKQHFDEIDAEFALAEGGQGVLSDGKVRYVEIQTTEKVPVGVKLTIKGTAGHGSRPRTDNAVAHLAAAVERAAAWQTPMRLNDTTRTYFERLALISTPEQAARYNGILLPEKSAAIQRYFAENEPNSYSILRTSVVPTVFQAGFRFNVIPSQAEAILDIRALPDENIPAFYEELKRTLAEPGVTLEPLSLGDHPAAPPSRLDNEMFRTLETVAKKMYPGAVVLPSMSTGATDMALLRAKGIQCYGIGSATSEADRINYGAHSDVERLLESSFYSFLEYNWQVVTAMAASR